MDTIPKSEIINVEPEAVEFMRKEYNMHIKEDREKAISIIEEWIKTQDHFLKKDFSRDYIEKSMLASKGSVEVAKQRIDTTCTMKTLMPQMFRITDLRHKEFESFFSKVSFAIMPNLTKEYYRVAIIKAKPGADLSYAESRLYFPCVAIIAEYLKTYDYNRGFYLVGDMADITPIELLTKINLVDLQQFATMLTGGFGYKIKGIFSITSSKWIETFLKIIKSMFSEKVAGRLHAVPTRKQLLDYIPGDVLSEEYGGKAKSVELLHEDLLEAVGAPKVQELLKEMSKAGTDESKRKRDKFNDKYMGMPGTFRTLSLD